MVPDEAGAPSMAPLPVASRSMATAAKSMMIGATDQRSAGPSSAPQDISRRRRGTDAITESACEK